MADIARYTSRDTGMPVLALPRTSATSRHSRISYQRHSRRRNPCPFISQDLASSSGRLLVACGTIDLCSGYGWSWQPCWFCPLATPARARRRPPPHPPSLLCQQGNHSRRDLEAEGAASEGGLEGVKDRAALLAPGGADGADTAEGIRAGIAAERARHLLVHCDHA